MRTVKFGLLLALLLLPITLPAANFVFVFHSSSSLVSIYNADSMELVGTPAVGAGAVRAFGVPDPNNPGNFLKFYVVTTSSVVALNPTAPFAVRASLSLSGALAPGSNSAALTGDGRRLLVAAGGQVHIINTAEADTGFAATIGTASTPTGIAVLPNSRRAYIASSGSNFIQIIDLVPATPQLLSTAAVLPSGPATAIAIPPNGSRIYAAVAGNIYEIDRVTATPSTAISNPFFSAGSFAFDPDPPVANALLNNIGNVAVLNIAARSVASNAFTVPGSLAVTEVATPGSNRAFLLAGSPGRLFQGFISAGGVTTEVVSPQTGVPYGTSAVDLEVTPDGSRMFVAYAGESRLMRLDPSGVLVAAQVTASLPPSGLSLVYAPATQTGLLEIYGGDNQVSPANSPFPATLAVRARASNPHPAFGQTVTFSTTAAGVVLSDSSASTNLNGVAETQVVSSGTAAFQVVASLTSGGVTHTRTFNLNGGPISAEGLSKVSGDKQMTSSGGAFPLPFVVRATNLGVPVAGLALTIAAESGTICPSAALTDENGRALFECTAGVVTSNTNIDIFVTDALGRSLPEPFTAVIVPNASDLPTRLVVESETVLTGTVRQTLADAIQVVAQKADGKVVSAVGVALTSPQDVTFNPSTPITDSSGRATASVTFGCFLGNGQIRATAASPGLPSATFNFVTSRGPAAQIARIQGDNQSGRSGDRLPLAVKVRVADICGNGIPGQSVAWSVSPAGAATLENVIGNTDLDGFSSALVRLGNRAGAFTVTATSGALTAVFNLSVTIAPTRLVLVSGNNQNVVAGQAAAQSLVVEVQDDNGVAASGVEVNFSVTAGAGTLSAARAFTDAQGRASTRLTAGTTLGSITVTASAINRSVTFSLTVVGRVPVVSSLGFVNGASFRAGWVPGSTGTIFGVGLMEGITGVIGAPSAPFPTTLRGVRVEVQGVDAPIISLVNISGTEQINIQVPFGIPAPGTVSVTIHNNGSSATFTGIAVFAVQPGIFEFQSGDVRIAAALHADFSVVTPSNPARRGEVILLFLTGLGGLARSVGTNVAGPIPPVETVTRPIVGINDAGTEVLGSFYAPGLYTAYQINFRIPDNAASGLAKLSVVADGVASQDSRIPIL